MIYITRFCHSNYWMNQKVCLNFFSCAKSEFLMCPMKGVSCLKGNDLFPTYQFWLKRKDKFAKFYLSPEEESVEIPAVMVFPPKFTLKSGSPLNIKVEMEHAKYVSAFLGKALKLDWIDMSGTLSEQGGQRYG